MGLLKNTSREFKGTDMFNALRNLAFALIYLSSCGSVGADELFTKSGFFSAFEPRKFEFLERIPSSSTMGGYPLLKLGGDLGLMHLKLSHLTGAASGIPLGNATLVDFRENKFFASIDMQGNLENGRASDWTDEPCKRNDMLWKRSTGGAVSRVNCATINHNTKFFTNPTGDFQQYLVKIREMKVEIPPTVIRIEFTRYSDNGRRLVYAVRINPEMFGFDRDAEPVWGANSWHKAFSEKDPKKTAFIVALSRWAEAVQDKMDEAFERNQNAFDNIPPITNFVSNSLLARQ